MSHCRSPCRCVYNIVHLGVFSIFFFGLCFNLFFSYCTQYADIYRFELVVLCFRIMLTILVTTPHSKWGKQEKLPGADPHAHIPTPVRTQVNIHSIRHILRIDRPEQNSLHPPAPLLVVTTSNVVPFAALNNTGTSHTTATFSHMLSSWISCSGTLPNRRAMTA